ncbi:hypothetical protein WJX82_003321 [Trebouxia sp. C0006]
MSFLREWWAQAVDLIKGLRISGRQESDRTAYSGHCLDNSSTGEAASSTDGPRATRPISVPRCSSQHHRESSNSINLETDEHASYTYGNCLVPVTKYHRQHVLVQSRDAALSSIKGAESAWIWGLCRT